MKENEGGMKREKYNGAMEEGREGRSEVGLRKGRPMTRRWKNGWMDVMNE